MAGNYPNAPSWRMAWDRDGTTVFASNNGGPLTQLSAGQMQILNDESVSNIPGNGGSTIPITYYVIFPELRDLDAFFVGFHPLTTEIYVSPNTTNGVDGTWTLLRNTTISGDGNVVPNYRTGIVTSTALAIKGIRVNTYTQNGLSAANFAALHLYGEIVPGQNPNRLALWHPTLDQRIVPSHFDWGDAPRSSSADRTFRVKNMSPTQTANSVRVAQEILTDTSPSVVAQHTLSTDATTFLAQVNVGSLGPGALSGVLTLRRVTPSNATLSVWAHRVFAEATSWS